MLKRKIAAMLIGLFLLAGVLTFGQITEAQACTDSTAVKGGNGEFTGLRQRLCHKKRVKTKTSSPKPDPGSPEAPESEPPGSGCLTDVGASPALRCAVEDKPGVPGVQAVFVPPTVAEVRVALRLPDPTPRFGPDPSVNEWKMLAVGYPVWLWTDAPTRLSATARHDGLAMRLSAQWTSTRFDMGDGHSRTCTATTVYPKRPDRYGTPSPTCGYTYQKRSKPGRDYTVTATTHWRVSWSTGGHSGTLMTSYAGQRDLPIGELQALIKG